MATIDTNLPTRTARHTPFEYELERGALIGRYVVVGPLGHGAMGTVYQAYDPQLNRALAVKLLHRSAADNDGSDELVARMLREAQAMARLHHPNVVVIHDVGTFEGRVFLAMEFVDGGTLKTWLREAHSLGERVGAMLSAGRGLAAAHAAGLVHRDFKPENVLVGNDGRVLVTDFGIARVDAEPEPASELERRPTLPPSAAPTLPPARDAPVVSTVSSGKMGTAGSLTAPLTMTGSILGTIGYMSPEQAMGETVDAASDQFSFCVTAYHVLYGKRPFIAYNLESYVAAIEEPLPSPPADAAVPAWMHRVLARGLSVKAKDRFPSMEALLEALQADPDAARRKKRNRVLTGVAAGLVLVGVGVAARARPAECSPDPADLAGVWDDAARSDVRAAFAKSQAREAKETAARVIGVLDDVAARWAAMRTESCEATRVKKRQSEEDYRLRSDCLDRRRNELRALAGSLRTADDAVVEKALGAAYGLTNVGVCGDIAMLRKSGGLPDDAAARAKVLDARGDLAKASSLQLVGRVAESEKEAQEALTLARTADHAATIAEAQRVLGALAVEKNEHAQAERYLTEANWTALRAGADALVVSTASMEAFVVAAKLGRPGEGRLWLGLANAALGRVGGSQELALEYEEHRAWLLSDAEGRSEEAIPVQEHLAQLYEELYGVHQRTLRALYNLGDARTSSGQHARACEAYAKALAMAEKIGGDSYEWTGYALEGRGDCLIAQGQYAEGDRAADRAVRIFAANDDAYSEAEALEVVIRSALAQGDDARAAALAQRAVDRMKGLDGTASLLALVNVPAGEAFVRTRGVDGAAEAEKLCAAAEKEQELQGEVDPEKTLRADALRCLGEARIALGRASDAIAPLERSVGLPHRTYPGDLARAQIDLARALVLAGGDKTRAMVLAKTARDTFAASPGLEVDRDAADKWIAAQ